MIVQANGSATQVHWVLRFYWHIGWMVRIHVNIVGQIQCIYWMVEGKRIGGCLDDRCVHVLDYVLRILIIVVIVITGRIIHLLLLMMVLLLLLNAITLLWNNLIVNDSLMWRRLNFVVVMWPSTDGPLFEMSLFRMINAFHRMTGRTIRIHCHRQLRWLLLVLLLCHLFVTETHTLNVRILFHSHWLSIHFGWILYRIQCWLIKYGGMVLC